MNENNNDKTNDTTETGEEFKMPEEKFGVTNVDEGTPSHLGIILGILTIILVLILGSLYLWSTTLEEPAIVEPVVESPIEEVTEIVDENTNEVVDVQATETLSTSDEIDALEADLNNTNMDALDAELQAIEAELDAALQ